MSHRVGTGGGRLACFPCSAVVPPRCCLPNISILSVSSLSQLANTCNNSAHMISGTYDFD